VNRRGGRQGTVLVPQSDVLFDLQPGSRQRLLKGDRVLEGEGSKLSELSVEYDDELLLVYQKEGIPQG